MLGKLVLNKYPAVAQELLPLTEIHDTEDLSVISSYYLNYCGILGIDPEKFRGPLYKREMVKQRNLFMVAILYLFNPNIIWTEDIVPIIRPGFIKAICDCTGLSSGTVSIHIRKTMYFVNTYEEEKEEMHRIVSMLRTYKAAG